MSRPLSLRQLALLRVVDDNELRDARSIDLVSSARHGASKSTVREELIELAKMGLLAVDETVGTGGEWTLTSAGEDAIHQGS